MNIQKYTKEELEQIKEQIQFSMQGSKVEHYTYYQPTERKRCELYLILHQLLTQAKDTIPKQELQNKIQKDLDTMQPHYNKIQKLLQFTTRYGKIIANNKLNQIAATPEITQTINAFSILTDKQNEISIEKIKGIITEGPSGTKLQETDL